jgi:hypothetical protein
VNRINPSSSPWEYHRLYRVKKQVRLKGYENEGDTGRNQRQKRREPLEIIVYKQGRCEKCGIVCDGKNIVIFDLHSREPGGRDVSLNGKAVLLEKEEIDSSTLVCKNCHALIHSSNGINREIS